VLIAGSLLFLFPLLWMLSTSLKPIEETMRMPPQWLPSHVMWQSYPKAIMYESDKVGYIPFLRYAVNTLYVAGLGVIGVVLSNAARVDGCSEFRIFKEIILPLAKPALAVVALFHFLYAWNDFLGPLIYLTDQRDFTLALGLQFYQSQHGGTEWNMLMAASTLVVLPVIVLFFFTQRTFIQGITVTGLKG